VSARPIAVAAVQLRAHDRAVFSERWLEIRARVADAAEGHTDLVIIPEGTVPGYVIGDRPVDPQLLAGALHDLIAIAARTGAVIVIGAARHVGERLFNSALVVTSAGVAGSADKRFLWHFDERWFARGNALDPVDTPLGRLGVFVCADGRIPTIASTLVDRGAELLVMPTAWVTSGRDPAALENLQADLMIAVRARENGVPVIAANKCGVEARSVAYCGKSTIVAADGNIVARGSQDGEEIVRARVAIGPPLVHRETSPPAVRRGTAPDALPERLRIAIAAQHDPALATMARYSDALLTIDPHTAANELSHEIALVEDETMVDPRALVGPRLDGVRLIVWHASLGEPWTAPFARTRAAELRVYVIVLDALGRRAFAVDPDGAIVGGTFGEFALAQFGFERARSDSWLVAPRTDVRAALEAVEALRRAAPAPATSRR
jgi:predicted amidohydrolase